MVEPGDIEDILDDYQALKELYEQVSEEPLTSPMQEYLEMIQGAMAAVEGRVTRDEMESDWDGIRKDALIEQTQTGEWPDWVPVDWDDTWEDWKADGGY